jgi:AcrR family transcriptional regulator
LNGVQEGKRLDTAERRERLKETLADAAERAVATRGLGGLKARDLAREVGCALGAIYTVFPDLDALILAVNSRTLALLDRHLTAFGRSEPAGAGKGKGPDPVDRLVALALGYLEFAATHRLRWRALFGHRLPEGQAVPDWHLAEQLRLFAHIEEPLRAIRPDLDGPALALLARSLFSAVHGVVSLGLEEKLVAIPMAALRDQTALIVSAAARGLMEQ